MSALLVNGIGRLLTLDAGDGTLGVIEDAAVIIEDGRFAWVGRQADRPARGGRPLTAVHAAGRLATPGLAEPHAHPIFAGSRANEFALRARGADYLAIQQAGGGILATVRATEAATDDDLVLATRDRLRRLLAHGVTLCEAKSGYALTVEGELRLLRLLRRVAAGTPVTLSPTLLAHVPPPGLASEERAAFVARFADEAIAQAADSTSGPPLAEALDVFCERGAFTLDETRQLLEAGRRAGLALRVHAEQLSHGGGARLAASLGALSAEHLEHVTDDDAAALAAAGTICTLLPGAALTLRLPFPDAARLRAAGCEIALGTDLNPGSCHSENLPLMMSLACTQMGLSVEDAWRAVTVVAARAARRPDRGRVRPGARADLVLWNEEHETELVQHLGCARAEVVLTAGEVVLGAA